MNVDNHDDDDENDDGERTPLKNRTANGRDGADCDDNGVNESSTTQCGCTCSCCGDMDGDYRRRHLLDVQAKAGQMWTSLVFGWFDPVVQSMQHSLDMGVSPDLNDDNHEGDDGGGGSIPPLPPDDRCKAVSDDFERLWDQEVHRHSGTNRNADETAATRQEPSLTKCLWKAFKPMFLRAGCLKAVHDCLQFVGPQVLNGLIVFLRKDESTENISVGLYLTAAVTVAQLCMSLCLRHYFFMCYRVGIKVRTAVLMAIYKKAIRIDSSYYKKHPIGQVTNLMSVDVQRLQDVISFLHAVWYSFLQIVLAMYFLWRQLGPSCLAGVFMIILSIPLTAVTASWMGKLQKQLMEAKDKRVDVNQETVTNMKVVKLQAWEVPFKERIIKLRSYELRRLLMYYIGQSCTQLLWSSVPLIIALTTFGAYVVIAKKSLDVASALTALALFEILRFPLFMLPNVINMIVEASVSMRRIQDFLSAPDYKPPASLPLSTSASNSSKPGVVIQMRDTTVTYEDVLLKTKFSESSSSTLSIQEQIENTESQLLLVNAKLADAEERLAELNGGGAARKKNYGGTKTGSSSFSESDTFFDKSEKLFSLRHIDFECCEGEFVAVVGIVGSGKSTLLKTILGESQIVSGHVSAVDKVAYFDQKPFIMNDTVKNNVLFGKDVDGHEDTELYRLSIKSACLEHDLKILAQGDQTEIGERGITLSGGQKARVAIARAVYRDADVTLLDDCLSAVDAHVGRELFDKCIIDVLLNQQHKISGKRRTVVLVTNSLQYLSNAAVDRIIVLSHGRIVESGTYKDLVTRHDSYFKKYLRAFTESLNSTGHDNVMSNSNELDSVGMIPGSNDIPSDDTHSFSVDHTAEIGKESQSLMTDEMAERKLGKVNRGVYFAWLRAAGGLWVIIPILFGFTASACIQILSNWWLTYWSHAASPDSTSQLNFLGVYGIINIAAIFADFGKMVVVMLFGLRASRVLYQRLLDATMGAPMLFYDTTPAGRIMNRFSKDMYTVDEAVPSSFQMYIDCFFQVMSTLVVITAVTPWFAVALLPMFFFYRKQQAYFSQCYRELKRLDSVMRSPIYALFGETLEGFVTIRAFDAQPALLNRMESLIDKQQHAYYLTQAGLCWLAVRLELVGTAIIFFACLASVLGRQSHPGDNDVFAGLAGLSISYALQVTQSLNWAVRTGSDYEANMVSVERLEDYATLDQEAPQYTSADHQLDESWPANGEVQFQNASLRYRPGLPRVLKGLNLTVPGRSKVGVVGRTGAGKSTLMTALMRLVELDGGKVLLDGVDTRPLGLRKLRSSIAVIPQDPVLFSGTIKTNLDPFDEHPQDRLMEVLGRVGLWSEDDSTVAAVRSLDDVVQQDGQNFSAGQRQLLVIGRALLDGAALVIIDEATSSIDGEADARIQKLLRSEFSNATTLTVAHRLNTIFDSDLILVMSDGKASEFDTPRNLLSKGGLFKDLVDKWEQEHK